MAEEKKNNTSEDMQKVKIHKNSTPSVKRIKILFSVLVVVMWLSVVAVTYKYDSKVSHGMTLRANTSNLTKEIGEQLISAKKIFSEDKNEKLNPDKIPSNNKDVKEKYNDIINNTVVKDRDGNEDVGVCTGCFKLDFKVMINEPKLCDGNVKLLMMITSKISNADGRSSIRETWGTVCNKPTSEIKCLFLFGNRNNSEENQELFKEHQTYHDIFQCDFYDVYVNLTYKTMMGLQWAIQHCPQAEYIMKTDDDMYINTELMPTMLEGAPDKKFIGGKCWGPGPPNRNKHSKWYVSFEQYTHPSFPRMCSGTGYVMSHDVAVGVVKMSADIPFFHLEDVYVAICVKKLGFQPVMITGFNNMLDRFEPCKYRNQILTSHGVNATSRISIWKKLRMCPMKELTPSMVYRFRYV